MHFYLQLQFLLFSFKLFFFLSCFGGFLFSLFCLLFYLIYIFLFFQQFLPYFLYLIISSSLTLSLFLNCCLLIPLFLFLFFYTDLLSQNFLIVPFLLQVGLMNVFQIIKFFLETLNLNAHRIQISIYIYSFFNIFLPFKNISKSQVSLNVLLIALNTFLKHVNSQVIIIFHVVDYPSVVQKYRIVRIKIQCILKLYQSFFELPCSFQIDSKIMVNVCFFRVLLKGTIVISLSIVSLPFLFQNNCKIHLGLVVRWIQFQNLLK